jgi:hypothetical protein
MTKAEKREVILELTKRKGIVTGSDLLQPWLIPVAVASRERVSIEQTEDGTVPSAL